MNKTLLHYVACAFLCVVFEVRDLSAVKIYCGLLSILISGRDVHNQGTWSNLKRKQQEAEESVDLFHALNFVSRAVRPASVSRERGGEKKQGAVHRTLTM